MKNFTKTLSSLILAGLATTLSGCGDLSLNLPALNQLGKNLQTLASSAEAQLGGQSGQPGQQGQPGQNGQNAQARRPLTRPDAPHIDPNTVAFPGAQNRRPAQGFAPVRGFQEMGLQHAPEAAAPAERPFDAGMDIHVDKQPLGAEALYKISFRIPDRFPDQIEENHTVRLLQFNHPGHPGQPMIVVRYGEKNGIPGIVVLHRSRPDAEPRIVGAAPLRKGQVNQLLIHVKWDLGQAGHFRVLYKAPGMLRAHSITGPVSGSTVFGPEPRVLKVGIFPGLQANLDQVIDGPGLRRPEAQADLAAEATAEPAEPVTEPVAEASTSEEQA
ncbi:MAG TPA: hypothetical protein V6D23_20660 [Candidatus Obscuribacterales bacterium]